MTSNIVRQIKEIIPKDIPHSERNYNKTILGPVPVEAFHQAMMAPAMVAGAILRRYDPLWGLTGLGPIDTFRITVSKKVIVRHTATIEIAAVDSDNARDLIDAMEWDDFSWREGYGDDDDHEIDSIKMIEGPESCQSLL